MPHQHPDSANATSQNTVGGRYSPNEERQVAGDRPQHRCFGGGERADAKPNWQVLRKARAD